MRKKVLIVCMQFYPEIGSSGNRMKNIYTILRRDYDVDVLTCEPNYPNKELYRHSSIWNEPEMNDLHNVKRVKVNKKKHSINMLNRLHLYIQVTLKMLITIAKSKKKYDAVYITSPPIFVGIVGLFAKWKFKSKFILDIRDLWPDTLKGVSVFDRKWIVALSKHLEKKLYQKAHLIIINSEGFYNHVTNIIKSEKPILFLPNALSCNEFRMANEKLERFSVIYTGNIGLAQNVDFLKTLANQLHQENIQFNVVGYGVKLDEFKKYVKEKNLVNVQFKSALDKKACLQFTKLHHVGIVSLTNAEVFETVLPGKLIDYIACGLPVIGKVKGYARQVIESNNLGFVSSSNDVREYVDFILMLKNSPEVYNKYSSAASKYGKEEYLWDKNEQKVLSEIEKIVRES